MSKPILLYPSFGQGPHIDEIVFSASSAALKRRSPDNVRIVIFTDDPKPFQSLNAEIVVIDAATRDSWAGPRKFVYRWKICAMLEALERFKVPVALVDGDTYFLKRPEKLFHRIAPGRSLMHLPEGKVGYLVALGHARHELSAVHVRSGQDELQLHPDWLMWNAGVVGIHPADQRLVQRVLALNDAIYEANGHKNSEQIAFTEILSQNTKLGSCRDIVFHYHQAFMRHPFHARLSGLLEEAAKLPANQQLGFLYSHRPISPVKKKIPAIFKRPLKRFGLFKADLNTSI